MASPGLVLGRLWAPPAPAAPLLGRSYAAQEAEDQTRTPRRPTRRPFLPSPGPFLGLQELYVEISVLGGTVCSDSWAWRSCM